MRTVNNRMSNVFSPHTELARLLIREVEDAFDGAHDFGHIVRVWGNATAIARAEGHEADSVLAAAVLLHDCVRVEKSSSQRSLASILAAKRARTLLKSMGWRR